MNIELRRIAKKATYTIGRLYVDNVYECDTIEDRDRGLTSDMSVEQIRKIKVASQTAIPSGKYKVTINVVSPKFSQKAYYKKACGGKVPRLLDVKGFDGILIHTGRDENSSAGCIIVGRNTVVGKVTDSTTCWERLYRKLQLAHAAGEQLWITIK